LLARRNLQVRPTRPPHVCSDQNDTLAYPSIESKPAGCNESAADSLSVDFACAHAASELEAQQEAAESATAKTLADAVEVARADAVAALTAKAQAEARSEVAEMLAKQQVRTIVLLAGTAVSELHADGSFIVCLFLLC
jgi:uncharacterized protein YaaN involved in tellurite resistance